MSTGFKRDFSGKYNIREPVESFTVQKRPLIQELHSYALNGARLRLTIVRLPVSFTGNFKSGTILKKYDKMNLMAATV